MGRGYSGSRGRFGGRSYGGYGTTGDYGYGAWGPAVQDVDNRIKVRRA